MLSREDRIFFAYMGRLFHALAAFILAYIRWKGSEINSYEPQAARLEEELGKFKEKLDNY